MDHLPHSRMSTPVEGVPTPPPTRKKPKALPLKIIYTERFEILDGKIMPKQGTYNYAPATVDSLNAEEASNLKVNDGLADNSMLKVGSCVPKEIIVVVRPKSLTMKKRGQVSRADPNVILPDELEMSLEVKLFDFAPPHAKIPKKGKNAKVVYSGMTKAITKQKVGGLYCFSMEGNSLEHLFTQIGTYMFHFSLVDSKYRDVPPMVVRVNVAGNPSDNWALGSSPHVPMPRKPRRSRERTSVSVLESEELDELPGLLIEPPKKDITLIHVTTLDEVVSVNLFFAIAVFLGLAFSPPLPANQVATSLAPPKVECYVAVNTYRAVILWEVLSFACFLFSTLVAHGFKLFIVLENGRDKDNSKSAGIDHRFLRFGIFASATGSILGAIFLIVSMIALIEVRLGSISCGNPWAIRTTIPFVALGASGCGIFIVAVLYESCLD